MSQLMPMDPNSYRDQILFLDFSLVGILGSQENLGSKKFHQSDDFLMVQKYASYSYS